MELPPSDGLLETPQAQFSAVSCGPQIIQPLQAFVTPIFFFTGSILNHLVLLKQ